MLTLAIPRKSRPMTRAECVRFLAESRGLTMESLAKASGVSVRTIESYWQNRNQPGWDMIEKLCPALGVSMDEFLKSCRKGGGGR